DDIERTVSLGHPPPVAVEDRVAEVEDSLFVGLEEPGDLRVAEAVDGGQRGQGERADLEALPDLGRLSAQPRLLELGIGLGQREVFEIGSTRPGWLVDG